jgi:hypothetical protein
MKKHLLSVLCLMVALIASGCATAALEKNTRSKALLSGMEPIAGEDDWVRDPSNGGARKVSAMTADEHPYLYRAAQIVDYGVLPAAGLYGLYQAAEAIDGGDSSDSRKTYNFYGDGDVTLQDGSPGASSDQSSRPTTTTTSTTTTTGGAP